MEFIIDNSSSQHSKRTKVKVSYLFGLFSQEYESEFYPKELSKYALARSDKIRNEYKIRKRLVGD